MQATRFWAAAFLAPLLWASAPGCGADAGSSPHACGDCAGEGGGAGVAGEEMSVSGSSAGPNGGAPAPNGGAAAGDAGAGGRVELAGSGAGAGGEGGSRSDGSEQLDLCVRLAQPSPNADQAGRAYTRAVTLDCRVKWIMPRGPDLAAFQNQVLRFNFSFWGCPERPPVDAFGLVFDTPLLSQGDVDLLIGHYLKAAQDTINLSPLEREQMQAALVRLSQPLISDPSLEPSKPTCSISMGGAGGMGGAGVGGADTAGAGAGGADRGGADTGGAGAGGADTGSAGAGGSAGTLNGTGGNP